MKKNTIKNICKASEITARLCSYDEFYPVLAYDTKKEQKQ